MCRDIVAGRPPIGFSCRGQRRLEGEHLAFEVDHPAEVDDAYTRCLAAGGTIQSPPEFHYGDVLDPYYAFFAFDPDGIRVEVCYWKGSPLTHHMTSPG